MRRRSAAAVIVLLLFLTGCVHAGSPVQTVSSESSQGKYKAMTGNVVVFGTSIWAIEPGPEGVKANFEKLTSFNVTDNSFLGGMATRLEGDYLEEVSLVSILFYNNDKYSRRMHQDILEADYVILAFGGNDQAKGVPASGTGNSFENALQISVSKIKEMNPKARIILIAPLNGWIPQDGEYIAFADIDNGGGKLADYIAAVERVAGREKLLCVKMSEAIVFSKDDPKRYFKDGSHLTAEGSRLYAEYLTEQIYGFYYSEQESIKSSGAS
ncbi:MAG: SGNH/GDSL hydrolase family protein [Saccharofermentans sp.]|nr:SGNH/GDSL hydrolase family protein [Saccharofermentans sp.]